jgi:hypothetical protein
LPPWQERLDIGERHEERVARELSRRGWTVSHCGQGTWGPLISAALRTLETDLRYFPDMIAARGNQVATIDAKDRLPSSHSNRYTISRKALAAGLRLAASSLAVPLYYVFGDLTVLTPGEVSAYHDIGTPHSSGSYYFIATHHAHRFDDVFGTALQMSA